MYSTVCLKPKNRTHVLLVKVMKRIFKEENIRNALNSCVYKDLLQSLEVPVFLQQYDAGEILQTKDLFQIVLQGNLSISFIRDDGSAYSLSAGGEGYLLGDMELFMDNGTSILAQADKPMLTIAIDAKTYREKLLNNVRFLRFAAGSMARKINTLTFLDAVPSSLTERVLNYMRYVCDDQVLSGIEKTAFRLHCSARQLQRTLNKLEQEQIVRKTGKGRYAMNSHHCGTEEVYETGKEPGI